MDNLFLLQKKLKGFKRKNLAPNGKKNFPSEARYAPFEGYHH